MVPYIILFSLIIIYLFFLAYIKVKYGFWSFQPVFHVYDFKYMIWPPGIINHHLPSHDNKFLNFRNINTTVFQELSDIKVNKFIQFIQLHYLQNKDNIYKPVLQTVAPYFKTYDAFSFCTFYNDKELLIDLKKGTTIETDIIKGVITSRPIHVFIHGVNNSGDSVTAGNGTEFYAYYIDYLCVDKAHRKKGIAQQLIQTHQYNQSHLNKNIVVSLFKREDELTAIVPLCVYSTYGFPVLKWEKPRPMHPQYKCVQITAQTFHLLRDFLISNRHQFDIVIMVEYANILELIKTQNIFVYAVMNGDHIYFVYFYRKTCIFIEKGMEVLSCFSTVNGEPSLADEFIQGFKTSFWKTAEKYHFGYAAIENISHNYKIIENLEKKTTPHIISPTAYYFYNFAYKTFEPSKVLIIN